MFWWKLISEPLFWYVSLANALTRLSDNAKSVILVIQHKHYLMRITSYLKIAFSFYVLLTIVNKWMDSHVHNNTMMTIFRICILNNTMLLDTLSAAHEHKHKFCIVSCRPFERFESNNNEECRFETETSRNRYVCAYPLWFKVVADLDKSTTRFCSRIIWMVWSIWITTPSIGR